MKAAVWNGPYKLSIQDVPRPSAAEGQVLVKTRAVGSAAATGRCSRAGSSRACRR